MFRAVFSKLPKRDARDTIGEHDVIEQDETAESYSAKIGRWAKETLDALAEDYFWGTLSVSHMSRSPLDHFHNWLQSRRPDAPPKLVTLVCSKASAIVAEFVLLVAPTSYDRLWRDVLEVVGWREEPFWLSKIVQVRTGPCLCDGNHIYLVVYFFRRIALPT